MSFINGIVSEPTKAYGPWVDHWSTTLNKNLKILPHSDGGLGLEAS